MKIHDYGDWTVVKATPDSKEKYFKGTRMAFDVGELEHDPGNCTVIFIAFRRNSRLVGCGFGDYNEKLDKFIVTVDNWF